MNLDGPAMFSSGVSNLWLSGFGDGGRLFLAARPQSAATVFLLPGSRPAHHLARNMEQVANFC